jgi:hypothetical protein
LPGSGRTSPFLARADLSAARRIATFWLLNNDHTKRAALRR